MLVARKGYGLPVMVAMITRLVEYIKTLQRAFRFSIPFVRRASFRTPGKIKIMGTKYSIQCPAENGCEIDFISVFLDDTYRLSRISRNYSAGGAVVDIGANVGWFSLAARHYFPESEIHAYEPNPFPALTLKKNCGQLNNFYFYPEAVGASDGFVDILCGEESNLGYSVPGDSVRQVSLQNVIRRCGGAVKLLKLDCEGAEWSMFSDPVPWKAVAMVTMEYHLNSEKYEHETARNALRSLGFQILEQRPSIGCGMLLAHRR